MKIFGQVVFLGIPLILAKFITPDQFGSYSLSMMLVYLLTSLFMHSVKTPFIKYANDELKSTGKINKSFSVVAFFWVLSISLFLILFLVFSSYIQSYAGINYSEFIFLLLALLGISVRIFFDELFLALNQRLRNARFWMFMGIFSVVYILISLLYNQISVPTVFLMFLLIPPVSFFIVFKKADYKKLWPFSLSKKVIKKTWTFSAWVAVGGTAVYFLNWGDNIVLRATLSLNDVGVYNLAYQIFKGIIVLTGFLNGYFLPFLSNNINNARKLHDYINRKRIIIMIIGSALVIFMAFTLPYLIAMFYGSGYKLAGTVLYFLCGGLIFSLYKQLYEPLFYALEKYKFIQITNVVLVCFNLALDYILVIMWQSIIAAAVATMFTYILMAVVYEIYYQVHIKGIIMNKSECEII